MPKRIDELLAEYMEEVSEANRKREARKLRDRLAEVSETDNRNFKQAVISKPKTNQQKAMRTISDTELLQEPFRMDTEDKSRRWNSSYEERIKARDEDVKRLNKRGKMLAEIKRKKGIKQKDWDLMVEHAKEKLEEYGGIDNQGGWRKKKWGKARKYIPGFLNIAILDTISSIINGDFDEISYDDIPILNEADAINVGGEFEDERAAVEDPWKVRSLADLRRLSREALKDQ